MQWIQVSLGEGGTCVFIITGLSSDSSALLTLAVGGSRECCWDCHAPDRDKRGVGSHLSMSAEHLSRHFKVRGQQERSLECFCFSVGLITLEARLQRTQCSHTQAPDDARLLQIVD